jgi:hypothetical protein
MIFTLEALPAQEGDCLLLHWGTVDKPRLAVIDGGPGRVYENSLKPRLDKIAAKRTTAPLVIDLVMVSHVDNDHIVGIKKLFRHLKAEAGKPDDQRTLKADRLWHNTFNDIVGDGIDKYYRSFTASFTASKDGEPTKEVVDRLKENLEEKGEGGEKAAHVAYDIGLILAGHGESRELRDSHKTLHQQQDIAALNHPFRKDNKPTLITAEMTPAPEDLAGLSFRVAGPLQAQIEALQRDFDKFLKKKGLSAEAVLAAYADTSVPNLSSIVTLVTMDGKSILLTGDARGDYVIDGLKKAKILKGGPLKVDILKVPHHGSARNLEKGFFETIVADTYVVSADGKHGNPDRESIEWLIDARGRNARYDIVLTYPVAAIDKVRKAKSKTPWKPAKHSLAALFKDRKTAGFKFKVIEGGGKIELGDKIKW